MPIARLEQCAFPPNRHVERGTRHEFLVIQVAGVSEWRRAIYLAVRRRHPHAAEKWLEWELYAGSERADHSLAIERDDLAVGIGILHRQEAVAEKKPVAGKVDVHVHLQDLHLEHVPGLRLGNR